MSRQYRRGRSLLETLNPFSRRVDRALEWKRSRRLGVEALEDRRMLAGEYFDGLSPFLSDYLNRVQTFALATQTFVHDLPAVGSALRDAATSGQLFSTIIASANALNDDLNEADANTLATRLQSAFSLPNAPTYSQGSFRFTISGQRPVNVSGFDGGLDALNFKGSASFVVNVGYSIDVSIGKDGGGFYINTTPDPEVTVNLSIQDTALPTFSGKFGSLEVAATRAGSGSAVNLNFIVDIGGGPKLTDLANMTVVDATVSGQADIDYKLELAFRPFAQTAFNPRILTDAKLVWAFGSSAKANGTLSEFGSAPTLSFNNVQLDLGSILKTAGYDAANRLIAEAAPVFQFTELLTRPLIPGFAEVAGQIKSLIDQAKVGSNSQLTQILTFFDNPSILGLIKSGAAISNTPELKDIAQKVDAIITKINDVQGLIKRLKNAPLQVVNFGSFQIGGASNDLRTASGPLWNLGIFNTTAPSTAINQQLQPLRNSIAELTNNQLKLPILESTNAFKLLLGSDQVPLFEYDSGELKLDKVASVNLYSQNFLIGPIPGNFQVNFGVESIAFRLLFGMDSSVFRSGDITQSIYVAAGPDFPLIAVSGLGFTADFAIGWDLGAVDMRAGVKGAFTGNLGINIPETDAVKDNRIRLSDIGDCLIEGSGGLGVDALLFATSELQFDLQSLISLVENLVLNNPAIFATEVLIDAAVAVAEELNLPGPVIDGLKSLKVGPDAAKKILGEVKKGLNEVGNKVSDEFNNFVDSAGNTLEEIKNYATEKTNAAKEKIGDFGSVENTPLEPLGDLFLTGGRVEIFKFEKRLPGFPLSIYTFEFGQCRASDYTGAAAEEATADVVADLAEVDGNGVLQLYIGPLAPRRSVAQDQVDEVFTVRPADPNNPGNGSVIVSAFGVSRQYDGAVRVYGDGGTGNDRIDATGLNLPVQFLGGIGDDQLIAGIGKAVLSGGTGSDTLTGGAADDELSGGDDNDFIEGRGGADAITGGGGRDSLFGDYQQDTPEDDPTQPALFGADVIFGGDGLDYIYAGPGDDRAYGGNDADLIIGGFGKDLLNGDGGDDRVYGEEGDDELISSAGADLLVGGSENDIFRVFGAALDTEVLGQGGNDTLFADYAGNVSRLITFEGGSEVDLMQLTGGGSGYKGSYQVGNSSDAGNITYESPVHRHQSIEFTGLEPINDLMVATELTVHASSSDDIINVVDGPLVAATQTTLVNFNGAFEEIRVANKPTLIVAAEGRNDTITVNNPNPGAELVDLQVHGNTGEDHFIVTPFDNGVQITVDGGPSSGSDSLNVIDSVGGQRIVLRQDLDPESGSIHVEGAEDVFFSEIERLHSNLTTNPNLVILKGDPFEPNDTRATAWYMGSGAVINVDPRIDPGGDVDFFRFVADKTGSLDFSVFFTHDDGDINIEILDASGDVIAAGLSVTDNERIVIPAVAGVTYYLRVFGAGPLVENVYGFSVINEAAPVPQLVDLVPTSDSGRNNTDGITFLGTSENGQANFHIVLDDSDFDGFNPIDFLRDTTNDDARTPGADYGVEVFNNGVSIGFAFYTGIGSTWRFTTSDGDISEGDENHISAAVWVRDRSTPSSIGRGVLSEALQFELDTVAPPVSFGLPGGTDGLVQGSDSGNPPIQPGFLDRVTNNTNPRIWGLAEADSVVRVFADVNLDGIINAGDLLIGQTVAVPYDGNHAFANGYWEITSALNLNGVAFALDGLRQLLVSAEDVAGNVNSPDDTVGDVDQVLDIFVDTQGPQVFDPPGPTQPIYIPNFESFNLFDPKPLVNGYTPLINQLVINIRDLPFRSDFELGFLYDALQEEIAESLGNYILVGDHVGAIGIVGVEVNNIDAVNGQAATATITLTFDDYLPDDRYTLTLRDGIVDPAGNALDGESNANGPITNPTGIPNDPLFPSGNGVPGGNFVARFTVDSRPEIGSYIPTTISIDTNGNFVWDPANGQIGNDFTNVDLTFNMQLENAATGSPISGGFGVHDLVFAGQFFVPPPAGAAAPARPFDQLAVFGALSQSTYRWLIDRNSDGVVNPGEGDIFTLQPRFVGSFDTASAIPVAGDFDNDATNGDEIGLYNAGRWALDTNRNFIIDAGDTFINSNLFGNPIVGDFNGDGLDDLAVHNSVTHLFSFDLNRNGTIDDTIEWGFPGVLEIPVAADMNQDGIDDIGLWVPRNSTQVPRTEAEWFFLISDGSAPVGFNVDNLNHAFEIVPFGTDITAHFGDEGARPIVGNFDPPVTATGNHTPTPEIVFDVPGDFNQDGTVDVADHQLWKSQFGQTGTGLAGDGNGDGVVDALDFVLWRNNLGKTAADFAAVAMASPVVTSSAETYGGMELTLPQNVSASDAAHETADAAATQTPVVAFRPSGRSSLASGAAELPPATIDALFADTMDDLLLYGTQMLEEREPSELDDLFDLFADDDAVEEAELPLTL